MTGVLANGKWRQEEHQGHLWLLSEVEASLGCMRLCLKTQIPNQSSQKVRGTGYAAAARLRDAW